MDKETIITQEAENDGQTVYLYYDNMAGIYLAYGLSAYYTTLITDPYLSYSGEVNKPVALLQRKHILYLRQSSHLEEHQKKTFYRFKLKSYVGNAGYEKWEKTVISKLTEAK